MRKTLLVLATVLILTSLGLVGWALASYLLSIENHVTVEAVEEISLWTTESCTESFISFEWGLVQQGQWSDTIPVWVRNDGDAGVTVGVVTVDLPENMVLGCNEVPLTLASGEVGYMGFELLVGVEVLPGSYSWITQFNT